MHVDHRVIDPRSSALVGLMPKGRERRLHDKKPLSSYKFSAHAKSSDSSTVKALSRDSGIIQVGAVRPTRELGGDSYDCTSGLLLFGIHRVYYCVSHAEIFHLLGSSPVKRLSPPGLAIFKGISNLQHNTDSTRL